MSNFKGRFIYVPAESNEEPVEIVEITITDTTPDTYTQLKKDVGYINWKILNLIIGFTIGGLFMWYALN